MNDGKHEFHEDNLKPRIANYMVEHEGFDPNPIITYGRKQGPDILATKGEIKRRIEVKGWPLETYADEKKKGQIKKTTPSTQARHWFGEALLGIILAKCEDEKLEIALGFPMMGTYMKLLNKIEWVRRKLGIYCYFLQRNPYRNSRKKSMNYHELKALARRADLARGEKRKRLVDKLIRELPKQSSKHLRFLVIKLQRNRLAAKNEAGDTVVTGTMTVTVSG